MNLAVTFLAVYTL